MFTEKKTTDSELSVLNNFARRHPIATHTVIIVLIAILGLIIAYLSLTLFTKHGQKNQVPNVVGISYSQAIEKLHDSGFKIEIRDSLYLDNVKPGFVVEQYPNAMSMVKPGRKVFLYINAVFPKQMVIDPASDQPGAPALAGYSMRQSLAMLEEAGFKNVKIVYLRGDTDRVVRVLANGKLVKVMEKVSINSAITLEVYDGSRQGLTDSIQANALWEEKRQELEQDMIENPQDYEDVSNNDDEENIPQLEESEPEFIEY